MLLITCRVIRAVVQRSIEVPQPGIGSSGLFSLLEDRPLVDIATHGGFTPLMYAAWFDHPESIEALMQCGALLKHRSWGNYQSDPFCRSAGEREN